MTTWHSLGEGSWWRPHADGRRAWHALRGYSGWELRVCHTPAPPFIEGRVPGLWLPTLGACKHVAFTVEVEGG